MKKSCNVQTPKAKTPPAKRMAEGGRVQRDITEARTFGQAQRHVPRQMAESGGIAGAVNRAVQKATRPKAEVEALERKARAAKRR